MTTPKRRRPSYQHDETDRLRWIEHRVKQLATSLRTDADEMSAASDGDPGIIAVAAASDNIADQLDKIIEASHGPNGARIDHVAAARHHLDAIERELTGLRTVDQIRNVAASYAAAGRPQPAGQTQAAIDAVRQRAGGDPQ